MTDDTVHDRFLELLLIAGIAAVKQQERIERAKKQQDRSVTDEDYHRAARKLADYVNATVRSIQPEVQDGQLTALKALGSRSVESCFESDELDCQRRDCGRRD